MSTPTITHPPADGFTLTGVLRKDRDAQGRSMLNGYLKGPQIGNGQHGKVYLAYDVNDENKPVAIKAIKRNNPRADKMKKLRARGHLPSTTPANRLPLTDKLGSTENKIRKEIAIMKKCRHINIVRLHEVIDDRVYAKIYMVMEYMAGGEIKWRNKDNDPILLVEQTQRIIRDVVLGLEYLHFNGIIHRDIKPANLLWTADRRTVKIADFGVSHFSYAQALGVHSAAQRGAPDVDPSLMIDPRDAILLDESDLSKTAGTPPFMAPEVVADMAAEAPFGGASSAGSAPSSPPGRTRSTSSSSQNVGTVLGTSGPRRPVTKAIDVWALGVTLYALLFGTPPFFARGQTEFVLYRMICTEDWRPLPTMGLDKIPAGSRHPEAYPLITRKGKVNYREPGPLVITLLDRLLEKDAKKRITLDEVKRHPWITQGIPDVKEWLANTAPAKHARIFVTDTDTSEAMSNVRFRWRERLSAMVRRTLRPVSSVHAITHRGGHTLPQPHAVTEPTSPIISPLLVHKGKQRAAPQGPSRTPTAPVLHPPRALSAERRSFDSVSTTTTRRRTTGSRRGSETMQSINTGSGGSGGEPSTSSITAVSYNERPHRHRFSVINLIPSGWRSKPSSPPPTQPPSSSTSGVTSAAGSTLNSPTSGSTSPRGIFSGELNGTRHATSASAASFHIASGTANLHTRYSIEALGRRMGRLGLAGAAAYGVGGGQLAAEMRASSWGEPSDYEHAGAYAGAGRPVDVMSVHSGDQWQLDEDAMLIGAGGVAAEAPPFDRTPGTSPVLAPRGAHAPPPPADGAAPKSVVSVALLQQVEADIPSTADPVPIGLARGPPTGAARTQATSPLAGITYGSSDEDRYEWSSSDEDEDEDDLPVVDSDDDDYVEGEDVDDEESFEEGGDDPGPAHAAPPRVGSGGVYDDDDSGSEEEAPVEIKRRRPSFAPGSSPPPRSFLSAGSR